MTRVGALRIGLVSMNRAGTTARFDYIRTYALAQPSRGSQPSPAHRPWAGRRGPSNDGRFAERDRSGLPDQLVLNTAACRAWGGQRRPAEPHRSAACSALDRYASAVYGSADVVLTTPTG
jgi:hypothetical protein